MFISVFKDFTQFFFQNSGAAQVFSLVAERRRKFQEIINRSSGEASQTVRPKSSATKWIPHGSTPQLTTAILEIQESMISLLIKLHHKLSAKQNSFCPPWMEDPEAFVRLDSVKYSHGDGISAIERILTKAAFRARQNKRCIQEICMKISPPVPPKRNGPADKKTMDKEERYVLSCWTTYFPSLHCLFVCIGVWNICTNWMW